MQQVLITGSNRGIGFALVKEYLRRGYAYVFATCRNPDSADALHSLSQTSVDSLSIVPLDVSDEQSILAAIERIKAQTDSLDVLINNAGIYPDESQSKQFGHLQFDAVAHVINTNAVSSVIVTQACVDLLRKGHTPRVVMVSSQMGSIARAGGGASAYRMSKSAMNMGVKLLSNTLSSDNIAVIATHPGHVATDMGGHGAPVKPADSARGLVKLIESLAMAQSGRFFNYNGDEIPW